MNPRFPKTGTWTEQQQWVEQLPESNVANDLHVAIDKVTDSQNLFSIDSKELPPKVQVEVFHHSLSQQSDNNRDSDSDDDDSCTVQNAVVTRKLSITSQDRKEEITLRVPGESAELLYKLKFGEDGRVKSVKKEEKPLSSYQTGLTTFQSVNSSAPAINEGVVVKANYVGDENGETLFSNFTRS